MSVSVLALHPPLLSAYVWGRMSPLLTAEGYDVAAPSLFPEGIGDVQSWWAGARDVAVAAAPEAEVVVAYSGSGVLLPLVAAALPGVRAAVFVDAVVPAAAGGVTVPSPGIRTFTAGIAVAGVLPPWTDWWPPADVAALLPDPDDQARLAAEAPRLSSAFFDVGVPVPAGWEPERCCYLQLSPAYDAEHADATARGWRTARLDGDHLDPLARPERVTQAVLDLLAASPSG